MKTKSLMTQLFQPTKKWTNTILSKGTCFQTETTSMADLVHTIKLVSHTIDTNFDFDSFLGDKEKALESLENVLDTSPSSRKNSISLFFS